MAHALVAEYIKERDDLLNTINVLKTTTLDRGGDPSPGDLEVMERSYKRIDTLDSYIKVVGEDRDMDAEARDKLMRATPSTPTIQYRNGGELIWDCLHANYGSTHDGNDQDAKRRWDQVMKRAAQHMGTVAENTTPTAGGFGGVFVAPVVGPVISLFPTSQPFLTGIGKQQAPNSMTFVRPRIVDPNFKTAAGVQTLEKAELNSVKFDVAVDNLNLTTVGGYLNVSQQLMSLHPSAWNIIVGQLQRRTAYAGEAAAIAELSLSTASVTPSGPGAAAMIAALFEAAALVYTNTGELPTWIAYGPAGWQTLGSLTDLAERPLFPFLGASNALGTSSLGDFNLGPLGLQQIVTPAITDGSIWLGNALSLEAYSYPFPILEAIEPSLLGRQVAVAEAYAFYRPTTTEAGPGGTPAAEANGAVKVLPAA